MEANQLPKRMAVLKQDINKLIQEFNNEVGLEVTEIHAAALSTQNAGGERKTVAYDVSIGMDF